MALRDTADPIAASHVPAYFSLEIGMHRSLIHLINIGTSFYISPS
ncbi:hypothetical protein ASZ90_012010 [hydrocarbon metagenome]|uniref:Uncharacterized protein n=1 Tax=hydrocarbon metagenome TaxID=938273 RepID=A0A0W8FBU7_9ZZZZ